MRDIGNMVHFSYTRQKEPLGLGHAVLVAKELVGNEPFAVLLGDVIIPGPNPATKQLIDVYEAREKAPSPWKKCRGKKPASTASSMWNTRRCGSEQAYLENSRPGRKTEAGGCPVESGGDGAILVASGDL